MAFEEAGQPTRIQAAPKMLLRILALFQPTVREVIEMLYEFEEPFVVVSGKFERTFGISATPLPEALSATVTWFRDNHG